MIAIDYVRFMFLGSTRLVRFLHNAELLNGEIFYTLREAQVLIEAWRRHYNAVRPHGSLGWKPPAPETVVMPAWPIKRATNLAMEAAMI